MRYPKKKTRLLVTVILVVCFSLVAALAIAQGSTPEKPKKTGERGPDVSLGAGPGERAVHRRR